jgi:hypothetical protein
MANTMTYDDWETLKERRATAKALRQQALGETVEGKMVSGRFVAPSWTQHLAQALRTYKAGKEEKAADQAMKDARKSMLDTYRNAFGVAQGETPSVDPGFGKPMPSGSVDPGFGMPMPGADMTTGPLGGQPASPGMPAPMPQPPAMQPLPESGEPMTSPLGQPMQEPMGPMGQPMQEPMGQPMGPGTEPISNPMAIARALMANDFTADRGVDMYMQALNAERDMERAMALAGMRQGTQGPQLKSFREGDQEVTVLMYPDGRTEEVARGPAWNPNSGGTNITIQQQGDKYAPPAPGYVQRTDESGGIFQEPIPGGPVDREMKEAEAKAAMRKGTKEKFGGIVLQELNRAIDIVEKGGPLAAGRGAVVGRLDPAGKASTLQGYFNTIKANTGFDYLSQMRQSSPTGGALGGIAVAELEMLQATMGNLDLTGNRKVLEDNLKRYYNEYSNIVHGTPEHIRANAKQLGLSAKEVADLSFRYPLSFDEMGRAAGSRRPPVSATTDEETDFEALP